MLASLDPLGLPLAVDVVPGDRADDPLYLPCPLRVKRMLAEDGVLVVGDSKMSALHTRATIVARLISIKAIAYRPFWTMYFLKMQKTRSQWVNDLTITGILQILVERKS